MDRWDTYFHNICKAIASKSPCLSRQIGAILVRDKSIVSTGFNGPARGYPHCGKERSKHDNVLFNELRSDKSLGDSTMCPRQRLGYKSGEGLHLCVAAHAECNAIANAARIGASTINTTLYMNCIIPCKNCAVLLINAGIVEVVVDDITPYDNASIGILQYGEVIIRRFDL